MCQIFAQHIVAVSGRIHPLIECLLRKAVASSDIFGCKAVIAVPVFLERCREIPAVRAVMGEYLGYFNCSDLRYIT